MFFRVPWRPTAPIALVILVAGCLPPEPAVDLGPGLVEKRKLGNFSIDFADTERAVFTANGNRVELRPVPGFCIAPESVDIGPASGFAMIGDCPAEQTRTGVDLPRTIPAIVSVSVAEDPIFGPQSPRGTALGDLERFLGTPAGLASVSRGGKAETVTIRETRQIGDALYVLVEDRDPEALPMLDQRFWRAFVELNGRMVLVTLSGFREGPMDSDLMLAHLAAQVGALRLANGGTVPAEEQRLAAAAGTGEGRRLAVRASVAPETAPPALPRPAPEAEVVEIAVVDDGTAVLSAAGGATGAAAAPVAALRPGVTAETVETVDLGEAFSLGGDEPAAPAAPTSEGGTERAPVTAPAAPSRP